MAIKLHPVNKMLLVEREKKVEEKPDQFGFVLPEKINLSKHITVNLLAVSDGSQYERFVGRKILVVQSMIEQVEIDNSYFNLISENGVVGILSESELF